MNTTNDLEMHLRSWKLRRPSAQLSARLFGRKPAEPARGQFQLQWLAPAAAALVVMTMVMVQRNNPSISGGTNAAPVVALIPSNQFAGSLVSEGPSNPAVLLPASTFGWTNERTLTSSMRSLSGAKGKN